MFRTVKSILTTTSQALPVVLALLGLTLPAAAQTGPTLKSLVATRGSITAGDLTFSNFQAPATVPFLFYGVTTPNDGSDLQVTAITTPDGRTGLKFTAINPTTGQPQPYAVDVSPGGAGGGGGKGGSGGGGGGGGLPGNLGTSTTANVTTLSSSAFVNFATAEYWTKSKKINLQASNNSAGQSMMYGPNVNGPALGAMQLSGGPYGFKITTGMSTAPSMAVIWIGAGGMITKPITPVDK